MVSYGVDSNAIEFTGQRDRWHAYGSARKNPLRLATVRSGSFVDILVMNWVRRLVFC